MNNNYLSFEDYKKNTENILKQQNLISGKRLEKLLLSSYKFITDYCIALYEQYKSCEITRSNYLKDFENNLAPTCLFNDFIEVPFKENELGYFLSLSYKSGGGLYKPHPYIPYSDELETELNDKFDDFLGIWNYEHVIYLQDRLKGFEEVYDTVRGEVMESIELFLYVNPTSLYKMKEEIKEL